MPSVNFMVGLAGSGKTRHGKLIAKRRGWRFFEENQVFGTPFMEWLSSGNNCVVEEICYSNPVYRDPMLKILQKIRVIEIEWICFGNDLESANWNCDHRDHEGDSEEHKRANREITSPNYTYPEGAKIRRVKRMKPRNG